MPTDRYGIVTVVCRVGDPCNFQLKRESADLSNFALQNLLVAPAEVYDSR